MFSFKYIHIPRPPESLTLNRVYEEKDKVCFLELLDFFGRGKSHAYCMPTISAIIVFTDTALTYHTLQQIFKPIKHFKHIDKMEENISPIWPIPRDNFF